MTVIFSSPGPLCADNTCPDVSIKKEESPSSAGRVETHIHGDCAAQACPHRHGCEQGRKADNRLSRDGGEHGRWCILVFFCFHSLNTQRLFGTAMFLGTWMLAWWECVLEGRTELANLQCQMSSSQNITCKVSQRDVVEGALRF